MKRFIKIIFITFFSVITIFTILGIWGYHMLTRAMPQTQGTLETEKVRSAVHIFRDKNNVPYIQCEHDQDAWFAQGFVTAQDRLWQMDFLKRYVRGSLSEIFGASTNESDSLARFLGFGALADSHIQQLPDDLAIALKQYAQGINFAIENLDGHFPVEFLLLNYKPDPWTPEDCLAIFNWFTWTAQFRWTDELVLLALQEKLGDSSFFPFFDSQNKTFWTQELSNLVADSAFVWTSHPFGQFSSMSWIVHDSVKTTLATTLMGELLCPALWYELHLFEKGNALGGLSLPGVPLIFSGHFNDMAWCIGEPAEPNVAISTNNSNLVPEATRTLVPDKLFIQWQGFQQNLELERIFQLNRGENLSVSQMKNANLDYLVTSPKTFGQKIPTIQTHIGNSKLPVWSMLEKSINKRLRTAECKPDVMNDTYSPVHDKFLAKTLQSLASDRSLDEQEKNILKRLQQWDRRMTKGSTEGLFVVDWQKALIDEFFREHLGDDLSKLLVHKPDLAETILLSYLETTSEKNIAKKIKQGFQTAIQKRISSEKHRIPPTWGSYNQLTYTHILGQHPLLAPTLNAGPYPSAGDGSTLMNVNTHPMTNMLQTGPVAQCIIELSQELTIQTGLSTGQSGHPFSPNYKDQTTTFQLGELHSNFLDSAKLNKTGWHKLSISPGAKHE